VGSLQERDGLFAIRGADDAPSRTRCYRGNEASLVGIGVEEQ
jgi:hypothetical protein